MHTNPELGGLGRLAVGVWTTNMGPPFKPRQDARSNRIRGSGLGSALGGARDVLQTYQLDGSALDMPRSQRVQRIRVRSWRVSLRDCSHF